MSDVECGVGMSRSDAICCPCYDDVDCSVIWWHLLRAQNAAGNLVMVILVAIIGDHLSRQMSFSSLQLVVWLQC
jgi:hypothetical protein